MHTCHWLFCYCPLLFKSKLSSFSLPVSTFSQMNTIWAFQHFFSKKAAKRWAPSLVQLQLENPCNLKPITSPSTSISFPASSPTTSEHERFLGKRGKPFLGRLGSSGAWDLGWAPMLRLGHWVLAPLPAPALLPAALPKHEGFLAGVWALVHQWQHAELPAGTWTLFSLSTCFDAALQ